jgi:hypothetical protein
MTGSTTERRFEISSSSGTRVFEQVPLKNWTVQASATAGRTGHTPALAVFT